MLVDDGSTDGTARVLDALAGRTRALAVIHLSRNFGSHVAISAGLDASTGDVVVVLTSDLQEPPELIPRFLDAWKRGYRVVWGVRDERADGAIDGLLSRAFTRAVASGDGMGGYPEEPPSAYFLLDRTVVDAVKGMRERNRMIYGLIAWTGFSHTTIRYAQAERASGSSGWSMARKIKLMIDAVTAFSYRPLRMASLVGIGIAVGAFIYAVVVVVLALMGTIQEPGFPTLLAAVLFLGGTQLAFLGLLGEYLWRALDEVRGRPLYVVDPGSEAQGDVMPGSDPMP